MSDQSPASVEARRKSLGVSYHRLAQLTGYSWSHITRVLREESRSRPLCKKVTKVLDQVERGEVEGKLPPGKRVSQRYKDRAAKLHALYHDSGLTQPQLAKVYNLSQSEISRSIAYHEKMQNVQ